jgi:glycosyltransferase involved in cell wall biosynthesis
VKIGIDARNDQTGVGRYTYSLIRELATIDRQNEYILFQGREGHENYAPPGPNFRSVEAEIPWFTVREQLSMPRLLARERLDLVHYPHLTVPLTSTTPFVVTIHDLNYLDPDATRRATGRGAFRHAVLQAGYRFGLAKARRARQIIAVSEHTRDEVARVLRVESSRIAVTHEGVDPAGSVEPDPAILRRLGLDGPFFLYVGAAYPYKNLPRLIDAFARVSGYYRLVLAGDQEDFGAALQQQVRTLGLGERVAFPGRVTDAELAALYDAALAYAFVSRREGFGLPALEAMAAGVPVVAARAGSLPEVCGEAARYCDPMDLDSIATALSEVATDTRLRTRLEALGRQRVAEFSWTRTAEQTLNVYRGALSAEGD